MNAVPASEKESILVIGYGNTLRGDDAVGRKAAEIVAGWNLPHVRVLSVHQLTPELAQDISACDQVLFVDARAGGMTDTVARLSIEASESVAALEHSTSPRTLLAFSRALFGARPDAQWVTVPGINFELGEGLSAHAERGMRSAIRAIARLLDVEQFVFGPRSAGMAEAANNRGVR
jgi:hydrogenase maturation protease